MVTKAKNMPKINFSQFEGNVATWYVIRIDGYAISSIIPDTVSTSSSFDIFYGHRKRRDSDNDSKWNKNHLN